MGNLKPIESTGGRVQRQGEKMSQFKGELSQNLLARDWLEIVGNLGPRDECLSLVELGSD